MSLLLRRRALISALNKGVLPSEYQQVEYIESTGTQYIDTGFKFNSETSILFDFKITDTTQQNRGVFGAYDGSAKRYEVLIRYATSDYPREFEFGYYNQYIKTLGIKQDTERHQIYHNKNLCYFDNVLVTTFNYGAFAQSINGYLLTYNSQGTPASSMFARLYGCKIWDDVILIRDFIPCYRKNDNVAGMYDIVNGQFYTNQGTGNFIVGG